jgi:hypothetical protein
MADEILSPTIEEAAPKVEPEPVVNEQMTEEAQLLEKLKAAGMNTPEKVDGAIRNATKTFEMQSERDQLANQLREMQNQISEAQKPRQPQNEYDEPVAVDLQSEIRKAIKEDREETSRQQAAIQQQQMKAWNTIQTDADFKLVEELWSEKTKDPNFIYGVQSGQVDPVLEYHSVKSEYFKGLMQKAAGTIETLQGGGAPKVHIESGEARTPAMKDDGEESEQAKILRELRDKANSGKILSEDEELLAIQASLSK